MLIGKQIGMARKQKGLSIVDLVKALNEYADKRGMTKAECHFTKSALSRIERDEQHIKTAEQIEAISAVLDISADLLIFDRTTEDAKITDELGLTSRTIEWLQSDFNEDDPYSIIRVKTGECWAGVVNFFFENDLHPLLDLLRTYIKRVMWYQIGEYKRFAEEYNQTLDDSEKEKIGLPDLLSEDWEEIYFRDLRSKIMDAREKYQKHKKTTGGDKNVETGER